MALLPVSCTLGVIDVLCALRNHFTICVIYARSLRSMHSRCNPSGGRCPARWWSLGERGPTVGWSVAVAQLVALELLVLSKFCYVVHHFNFVVIIA